ncbi:PAS domain S-box protein [Cronbergia sp. UHCC 0137]|uniref:PAS domain S-box protein n=1 Tax=Cronbergia sp. UHCC 0137 TaxID=3110239 RepID=UPI002B20AF4B|nr:PAS domain S-box protein [Cronbergia sp. UHCC 0137]MEA5617653.1 PAS domain S-box protein [Cronbergia sp. UHCC 0137]
MLLPNNENQRLKALDEYQIINTESEETFDELSQLAADFCDSPMAAISLVETNREWFKSKIGFIDSEIPRDLAFGNYTIQQNQLLIVPDALEDQRFISSPLVISDPYCRFYAGIPLINSSGFALGCLCVMDFVPRNLDIKEQKALNNLAKQVIRYLDLHRQKVIQDSDMRLKTLFAHHSNPLWIYDSETLQFLDVNEAAVIHYGYSREEFLQMQITDIRPSTEIPALMKYLATKETGLTFAGQWQHRHKNGHLIDVEIVAHTIDYHGHKAEVLSIQDITRYKTIERKFQESEARFVTITHAIPIPLMILRVYDGVILYANPEFMQTFRFTQDDLLNKPISDLCNEVVEFKKLLETLSQTGYLHNYELQLKRADGENLWAIASLQYLSLNNELVILTVFYDITARKNAESKLQQEKAFLQSIFEEMPLMIAINTLEGKIQWVNKNLEQTLGWNLKDFQTFDVLAELYPEPEYYQYVIDYIQSAQPIWKDLKTQLRDGRILDTSWTNIQLPNGQIVGIGQDITQRKQVERVFKIQAEREQLMRTVAERIRESLNLQDILNATVKEIRDLLEVDRVVVYQFSADMSGTIVAESVISGCIVSLGVQIEDTCFKTTGGENNYQGRKRAIANIYKAQLTDCHLHLLEQFGVKANLVVPIVLEVSEGNPNSRLWGLLIAHQCSDFREWEESQLDLLDQLTVPIAIAIQQSSIFQQAQNELIQREQAEIKLRSALAEKEVLLKEVHHRVKNNLQIVSSLLQLQSQTLQDPQIIKVLRESQNRIESISLIHKNLYTNPNIGQINVAEYINNLASGLLISYQIVPGRISLQTNINPVQLDVDQAIPCGLVINELISNALKHAFPNQQTGIISITLCNYNKMIELEIRDNGIGLAHDLDWENTTSLGLSLVHDLVTEQLEGNITIERNQGTIFKIQFPQLTLHQ